MLMYNDLAIRETYTDLFRKWIGKKRWSQAIYEKGRGFTLIRYKKNGYCMERKYKKYGWFYRYLTGKTAEKKLSSMINKMI
jgi:hypothetical protein